MNPERWSQIRQVYESAVALDSDGRPAFLDSACNGDSELRREVESLLQCEDRAESSFLREPAVHLLHARLASSGQRSGTRIGVYQILEEIGRGGMGEVYRACRVDGEFDKEVAVKMVRGGYDSHLVLERFLHERQILASLDHPNIARLLDGGTTEDGIPYLVMELIEGKPVDEYCDRIQLSISERLALFRQVCSAVQYAHGHLVVHRDIKPGNILVTADGVPKLLDFGIAKILDSTLGSQTTLVNPLTPEYASPEQVRGEPITTATDVYSLGVVLYRLLTGVSPYGGGSHSPTELVRLIAETEPRRPSTVVLRTSPSASFEIHAGVDNSSRKLSKRLHGDLDAIVLKALRKEAEQRYAAVELFSDDIRRELEGLPVTARKGSWSYRTRKFVHRNRIAVTAAMVVGIAIVVGIAATVREARIASANAQRAERRFNDVRKLSNSLIFEVHDSIQDLPGSTAARQIIIRDAVQYLDVLASEGGNDVVLQRELASAYLKLGTVQGNAVTGNLGDINGARRSYEKAISILQLLAARDPGDAVTQKNLASAYGMLGDVMWDDSAPIYYAKALDIREKLTQQQPNDASLWGELAKGYQQATTLRINRQDFEKAKELAQKSLVAAQRYKDAQPGGTEAESLISVGYTKLGIAQENLGQLEDALRSYTDAMEIDRKLSAQSPESGALQRDVSLDWQSLARVKMARKDYSHALNDVLTSMAILERLSRVDPADKRTKYLLALTHECAGLAMLKSKQYQSALNHYREALNICRCRSQWDAQNAPPAQLAGIVYKEMGDTYRALAQQTSLPQSQRGQFGRSACSSYVQSLAAFDHLRSIGSLNSWNEDTRTAAVQGLRECPNSSVK